VDFKEGKIKIYLTETGILMEGHSTQIPGSGLMSAIGFIASLPRGGCSIDCNISNKEKLPRHLAACNLS
jgi:hypothetical protein